MANSEIIISRATKEDEAYIEEKLNNYLLDSTNATWRQFFVLKSDSKTVAFGRIINHGDYLELASLGVDYYHRKKGYGRKILLFIVREAARLNPEKPIYGVTHRPGFLEGGGFREVDKHPDYLEHKRRHICKLDDSEIKIMKYFKT